MALWTVEERAFTGGLEKVMTATPLSRRVDVMLGDIVVGDCEERISCGMDCVRQSATDDSR